MLLISLLTVSLLTCSPKSVPARAAERILFRSELIFPPHSQHNHGSCIIACPDGSLLACWYRGSGERSADDVAIYGARLTKGSLKWSDPFLMADTPGFPDCNPCLIIDHNKRLWMFWPTILDNHWESALLQFKTSRSYTKEGCPKWEREGTILLKPGPDFQATVERDLDNAWAPTMKIANDTQKDRLKAYLGELHSRAADKLKVRLGWMPRAHPFVLENRLIIPLYSDGFDFSLLAMTDDGGATWTTSAPIVSAGAVQPTLALRKDGTFVAYFRDNGPPPQRVLTAESRDRGQTWSMPNDTVLPDPGAGLEVLVLKSGRWLLIHNNTEQGRHRLSVSISEDEGRTWPLLHHLEDDTPGTGAGSYAYPSILQAKDGTIHATYTYNPNAKNQPREGKGETIKHVQFTEAWLMKDVVHR